MPPKKSKSKQKTTLSKSKLKSRPQSLQFSDLPEHIRLKVWKYACSVPRVVELFEFHDTTVNGRYLDDMEENEFWDMLARADSPEEALVEDEGNEQSSGPGDDGDNNEMRKTRKEKLNPELVTITMSKTRPPAILAACRESRIQGLAIYKAVDDGIRTKTTKYAHLDRPIYVNPEVDVIFRGHTACDKGDAFRIRCKEPLGVRYNEQIAHTEPVAFTRTLAVDLVALTKTWKRITEQEISSLFYEMSVLEKREDEAKRILGTCKPGVEEVATLMIVREIAKCAERGLRNLAIVVGNDDDASEFNLAPLEQDCTKMSPRERGAMNEAESLRVNLAKHWERLCEEDGSIFKNIPLPNIQVVTVERVALKSFAVFPKLPVEIQQMIWQFALHTPRVISLAQDRETYEPYLSSNSRIPAMLSVCHASRELILKSTTFQELPTREWEAGYEFYNPLVDIVRLEQDPEGEPKDFAKYNIRSVGIPFGPHTYAWAFKGKDAKAFHGLEEIVVLLGQPRIGCHISAEPVSEDLPLNPELRNDGRADLKMYLSKLRHELKKASQSWKAYQRRRERQGKSSPDWIMPTVRVAIMKEEWQTKSPYLYQQETMRE
ncbi:hypothetical protein LSUE1_G004144 [Lachnellula suecica]|uniref:2EXR domain-containing protein n=1 Tax=Lachnellula suecica TaxID=602035 RepID=A0A8T9C8M7_9HELO|nr:hypothetical protein LSUE1_G004144 [Lachnellula suecica]